MIPLEKTIDLQRRQIEQLSEEIEGLKEQLQDVEERRRQRHVAQTVGYDKENSIWTNPSGAAGWVAFISGLAIVLYQGQLWHDWRGLVFTVAGLALATFGVAYAAARERNRKFKEYLSEYQRLYGAAPRFVADL